MEEGDIYSSFIKGLGLALAPKRCPDQSQAFKEVNNSQEEEKQMTHFVLAEPLPGAPRHVCAKFRANARRTDCVGPIISQIKRPKSSIH